MVSLTSVGLGAKWERIGNKVNMVIKNSKIKLCLGAEFVFIEKTKSKPFRKVNGMLVLLNVFTKVIIGIVITCSVMNCAQKKVGGISPTKSQSGKYVNLINPSVILVDPDIYKKIPFVDNSKTAAPYLSMNIDFDSITVIRKDVERIERLVLQNRGEAHITVITPPEFEQLKSVLSMELLNEVALLNRIQETPFEIVCVGRGQLKENRKVLSTYYVVLEAPELVSLRQTIATLYRTRGGPASGFNPDDFYPHITVGFTERDLHQSDGVIKSKASCLIDTQLKAQ